MQHPRNRGEGIGDVRDVEQPMDAAKRIMAEAAAPVYAPKGSIVLYTINEADVKQFERLGGDMATCKAGDYYPAMVVDVDVNTARADLVVFVKAPNQGYVRKRPHRIPDDGGEYGSSQLEPGYYTLKPTNPPLNAG